MVLSVIGSDSNGEILTAMLDGLGVETHALVQDPGRLTIVKERMLGWFQSTHRAIQQLLRVDNEDARPLDGAIETAVIAQLERELERADGVLVSDINKGYARGAKGDNRGRQAARQAGHNRSCGWRRTLPSTGALAH